MQCREIDPDVGWMAAGIITIKTPATEQQAKPREKKRRKATKRNDSKQQQIAKSMQHMSEVPHLINAQQVRYSDVHTIYWNVITPCEKWANVKECVSTYAIYNNNWGH